MPDHAPAWLTAWAKSDRDKVNRETLVGWLPLHVHLADASGVAAALVGQWVSPRVLARIVEDIGGELGDVAVLVRWLAAVHDVGKLSPAFASQVPELTGAMREHGLVVARGVSAHPSRPAVRHERVSELAVRDWLPSIGFDRVARRQLGSIVGAHHGVPAKPNQLQDAGGRPDLCGVGPWSDARHDALRWATDHVGGDVVLARFAEVRLSPASQVLCSAIVIMADWIASNSDLFPMEPLSTLDNPASAPDADRTAARVTAAWSQLQLPSRWQPESLVDVATAFGTRFDRAPGSARPSQRAAVEVATHQDRPGLVIVEAPMGEGKTEAALLAAEVLAARSGADGCFVALPTRATSDAMLSRVLRWMRRLPGLPTEVSVMLAHSTSSLNDEYRELVHRGRIGSVGEDAADDEVGVAHQWLRGRKRGPLAQFVVGTVDQILLGALRSRHLMLRHLAIAGKVVIIDEVHAYDVYMSSYLDRALHWLGAYGTPVVLLSATLPVSRRAELVQAYESGSSPGTPSVTTDDTAYPLVSGTGIEPRSVPAGLASREIRIEHLDGVGDDDPADLDALVDTLRDALSGGGCAVVIRNTVARVQATADRLVEEFGDDDVTVTHSRFLAVDRARLDADLLRRFGPPGSATERPTRHVVVASQVVEQSLDVDFDLMVTDLAPVDLVLQRLGRLHRHDRERPERLHEPRLVVTGVDSWGDEPVRATSGSRRVYGEHTLLRSAALLVDRTTITVPEDIAPLVQTAYGGSPLGPPSWKDAMQTAGRADEIQAVRRTERADTFRLGEVGGDDSTLNAWLQVDIGDAENEKDTRFTGQVRDGAETLEVLVVQSDRDGGLLLPEWVPRGGTQIPLGERVPDDLARRIAACALRLPVGLSQLNPVGDGVLAALERHHYPSFDRAPLLAGQLVLVLDEERTAELHHGAAHVRLTYDLRRGLLTERLDG